MTQHFNSLRAQKLLKQREAQEAKSRAAVAKYNEQERKIGLHTPLGFVQGAGSTRNDGMSLRLRADNQAAHDYRAEQAERERLAAEERNRLKVEADRRALEQAAQKKQAEEQRRKEQARQRELAETARIVAEFDIDAVWERLTQFPKGDAEAILAIATQKKWVNPVCIEAAISEWQRKQEHKHEGGV